MNYRIESDSVGSGNVPADSYYGIQALRAYQNFRITGRRLPESQIVALANIKKACAMSNMEAGLLDENIGNAIIASCNDIVDGKFHDQFILDPIQGGAGTSSNMNANEVVANIALEKLGKEKGQYEFCHPNDHVNMSQSTNDVYPTSVKIALYITGQTLLEKLKVLGDTLEGKSREFSNVMKLGRTQLMDAVPITLGQEFKAYATVVRRDEARIERGLKELLAVNMGATAVGTGINVPYTYFDTIIENLGKTTGLEIRRCDNLVDGTQNIDCFSVVSSAIKTCAISLSKMANDIRLMSSGPRGGLGEITIPAKQNGSSIMPGKINPVIPEVLNQCAFGVIGNDMTVTMACEAGQLELNAFEPVVFDRIYDSMVMLSGGIDTFTHNCIEGIEANPEICKDLLNNSTAFITALNPVIGYKKAAEIAKDFLYKGIPVIEDAKAKGMTEEKVEELLDVSVLTKRFEKKEEK